MEVTRREGLLALVAGVGGVLVKAFGFGRLSSMATSTPERQGDLERGTRRTPSLQVEPDPHSVKRHG